MSSGYFLPASARTKYRNIFAAILAMTYTSWLPFSLPIGRLLAGIAQVVEETAGANRFRACGLRKREEGLTATVLYIHIPVYFFGFRTHDPMYVCRRVDVLVSCC